MLGIGLALLAAVSWGVSDFIGGTKSRVLPVLSVLAVAQAFGFVWCACIAVAAHDPLPDAEQVGFAVISGVALLIGFACFYKAIAVGKISLVVPVTSMSAAIPVIVGIATGDRPDTLQVIGMCGAMVGVLLTSRERDTDGSKGSKLAAGVVLAVAAAVAGGVFFLATDAASDTDPVWASLFTRATMVAILCMAVLLIRPPLRDTRPHILALAVAGTLDVTANVLFATASTKGLVSLVSVAGSLFPVITVLLARSILHERVERIQAGGMIAVFCGVGLIAAG